MGTRQQLTERRSTKVTGKMFVPRPFFQNVNRPSEITTNTVGPLLNGCPSRRINRRDEAIFNHVLDFPREKHYPHTNQFETLLVRRCVKETNDEEPERKMPT